MKPAKKIVIVGPVPPPTGGISIHIWRLWHLLKKDFDVDFIDEFKEAKPQYFNLRSKNLFRYYKIISGADAVFIHSGTNVLRVMHILTSKLMMKKIVMTIHNYHERKAAWKRIPHELLFNLADKIILVNPVMKERLDLSPEKVVIKHAFLPPVLQEENDLPEMVDQWLRKGREENRIIICSNAWRLDEFRNQDLYGTDMCIEATHRLVQSGIPVIFLFNVATMDNFRDKFEHYQQKIKDLGLENIFHLTNLQLSFVKLMERSDIVVRPTNIDGDSLSIREAIYLGKPVIASDVTERPEGSTIHQNRNIDDFVLKISETITGLERTQHASELHHDLSYYKFYKELFVKLLN